MRAKDYCKECNKYISVVYADKKCPECNVLNPVKPNSFFELLMGVIIYLGGMFGLVFLVGLIIVVFFFVMMGLTR